MKKVFEYMNWCKKEFACHHYDFCSASGDCKLEQWVELIEILKRYRY